MAVQIDILYLGDLKCRATHGPSGQSFATEAPVDNGGKGEAFSPTDLLATALGTCIITIMGLVAQRHQIDLAGTQVQVEKEMAAKPVRRIGTLRTVITVPADRARAISQEQRDRLGGAARHCPVHASLHPDTIVEVRFVYEDVPQGPPHSA